MTPALQSAPVEITYGVFTIFDDPFYLILVDHQVQEAYADLVEFIEGTESFPVRLGICKEEGIPFLPSTPEETEAYTRNAEEFLRKLFGDNYKEREP
jgi:hypothetical protein